MTVQSLKKANLDLILESIHSALVQSPLCGADTETEGATAAFNEARSILDRLPLSPEMIREIDEALLHSMGAGELNGFVRGVRFAMSLVQESAGLYSGFTVETGLSLDERAALLRYMRRCAEYSGMKTDFCFYVPARVVEEKAP